MWRKSIQIEIMNAKVSPSLGRSPQTGEESPDIGEVSKGIPKRGERKIPISARSHLLALTAF